MRTVVSMTDLPPLVGPRGPVPGRHLLEGAQFGLDRLTLVLGQTAPGASSLLHRHDYEEIFIVHGGRGTYTVGDEVVEAGPGQVVVIPSGVPHRWANLTEEPLFHTAVHSSGTFAMDVVDPEARP